jgi:uncharacterized protein
MAENWVGKPCPKCRHVRAANEVAPDWQCPKCGVAYAKFVAAQQAAGEMGGTGRAPSVTEQIRAGQTLRGQGGQGSTGLAMFAHLSALIGLGLLVPCILWMVRSGKDELVVSNAKEAINFQISTSLWSLAIVGLMFLGPKMVWVALALLAILVLAYLILPIVAAVKANGGDVYSYPFTLHIFS